MEDTALKMTAITPMTADDAHLHKGKHGNKRLLLAAMGSGGALIWIVLFNIGMLIDSSVFRTTLTTDFSWNKFFITLLAYTPSNIALLCLVSAFIGGCSSLLVITKIKKSLRGQEQNAVADPRLYNNETPVSAMFQGILVYFAFLAGVFITSSATILKPTAESYTQAAGIVSMLAFLAGYDPGVFRSLTNLSEKFKAKDPSE